MRPLLPLPALFAGALLTCAFDASIRAQDREVLRPCALTVPENDGAANAIAARNAERSIYQKRVDAAPADVPARLALARCQVKTGDLGGGAATLKDVVAIARAVRAQGATSEADLNFNAPAKERLRVEYPDRFRRVPAGIVLVDATVDASGKVKNARVLLGLKESLDKAAIRTIKKWRFEPRPAAAPREFTTVVPLLVSTITRMAPEDLIDIASFLETRSASSQVEAATLEAIAAIDAKLVRREAQLRQCFGDAVPQILDADATPLTIQPRKTRDVKPTYPPDALRRRIAGVVELGAVIAPTGQVACAWVEVSSGSPLLDSAGLDAVRRWIYAPNTAAGAPHILMASYVAYTFN